MVSLTSLTEFAIPSVSRPACSASSLAARRYILNVLAHVNLLLSAGRLLTAQAAARSFNLALAFRC